MQPRQQWPRVANELGLKQRITAQQPTTTQSSFPWDLEADKLRFCVRQPPFQLRPDAASVEFRPLAHAARASLRSATAAPSGQQLSEKTTPGFDDEPGRESYALG